MNKIIYGDALEEMQKMPSLSIDLCVTSPPYNIATKSKGKSKWPNSKLQNGGYDNYADARTLSNYNEWQHSCLLEMMRLIKDNGAIFYNHKWIIKNGILDNRVDIIKDLPVRQIIIWERSGGINFNKGYFLPTYEVIYLICKKDFRLTQFANARMDVWRFNHAVNNAHPAPFPLDLPWRCIQSTDAEIILDPFCGSGTTCIAAKKLGKQYIGIDNSKRYCEMAENALCR